MSIDKRTACPAVIKISLNNCIRRTIRNVADGDRIIRRNCYFKGEGTKRLRSCRCGIVAIVQYARRRYVVDVNVLIQTGCHCDLNDKRKGRIICLAGISNIITCKRLGDFQ